MKKLTVKSLDMWGHVGADCTDHDCPCVVDGEHDEDKCDCSEDCNAAYKVGEIEIHDSFDGNHSAVLYELHRAGFLSDKGLDECTTRDCGDGEVDVDDADGRRIFALEFVDEES